MPAGRGVRRRHHTSMGEIVTSDQLIEMARDARAAGRTVAFVRGCFDLLHTGHVRSLESAAARADLLAVGVYDDASARAVMGPARPVMEAAGRAELVAALRVVDYVVLLREAEVGSLVERLQPEFQSAGGDEAGDLVARISAAEERL